MRRAITLYSQSHPYICKPKLVSEQERPVSFLSICIITYQKL